MCVELLMPDLSCTNHSVDTHLRMLALILRSDQIIITEFFAKLGPYGCPTSYGATSVVELVGGDMGSSEGHSYYWWEGPANK